MRQLPNWLDAYMQYMQETESATVFHKWAGMSAIAAALKKKVSLSLGRIRIYTNMYVVFVGEPGGPRKSQAISFIVGVMNEIPGIAMSADSITQQALIADLEACAVDEQMPDGTVFRHASLNVISKEFESFLGQRTENTKMCITLTDLFDAQEMPWKYRTKHCGTNVIPSVFFNILAATTPESIASSLPTTAIGSGLTSRIMFIWADDKNKKVTAPVETPEEMILREKLIKDLYLISTIAGRYEFDKDSFKEWDHWYQHYDERNLQRICKDPTFNGWYERKPLYILKLSIICAAAESNEKILYWRHIERAIKEIESVELPMSNVFRAVGRSQLAPDVDLVLNIVRSRGVISEKQLMSIIWRDVDSSKFDNVIATITKTGKVAREYKGPKGEPGIWYRYIGG